MVLSPDGAVLLLIDLQERLMPVIADHEVVVARAVRLAEAATLLDVPVRATEQNPAGLGRTVPPLSGYPQAVLAKTTFSAAGGGVGSVLMPVFAIWRRMCSMSMDDLLEIVTAVGKVERLVDEREIGNDVADHRELEHRPV